MEEKQGEVELEKSPWNIGKLTGEINEDFLPLNSDSTAPLPSKRLEIFFGELSKYEAMLKDEVRKRSEKRDQKEEEKFTEALLRELDKIYRDYIERIFFRRKKLPGIKGPREKPTIKITLEDGAEDKDKEKEGVKRPRRFISGTYNVIMLL